ncbi:MAG TPA: hypothetical protein VG165_05755 [Solirubrobacteraceae bacterium]|nr:hypothetical protein [Solirubrobacteraceae bacterium]
MGYEARPVAVDPIRRGVWATLRVEVVRSEDGAVVGSYERNYPSLLRTFFPFARGGREFALYSTDYTATRVMELPSCVDLGGEERSPGGFCPVEYFVPTDADSGDALDVGFVAGCIWGDDSSWKLQALNLSRVEEGCLARDERFGYVELPDKASLSDVLVVRRHDSSADFGGYWVEVEASLKFQLDTGEQLRSYDV